MKKDLVSEVTPLERNYTLASSFLKETPEAHDPVFPTNNVRRAEIADYIEIISLNMENGNDFTLDELNHAENGICTGYTNKLISFVEKRDIKYTR